jgi:hypothetical protein
VRQTPGLVSPRSRRILGAAALLVAAGCAEKSGVPEGAASAPEPRVAAEIPAAPVPETTSRPAPEPAPANVHAGFTPPPVAGDRIYSRARFAWIQPEPRHSQGWLGYLGLAGSVRVKDGSLARAKVPGTENAGGCQAWYAVEPAGYVCAGDSASIDPNDAVVKALAADAPLTTSPWPYEYAESIGTPRYARVPSAAEQRREEWDLEEHLGLVSRARGGDKVEKLLGVDVSPAAPGRWGAPPDPASLTELSPLVRESRKRVVNGSTVAYTRVFDVDGRTFVVTHDHAVVPKDRLKPYPRSEFHGVELGREAALPIAFFRAKPRSKWRRGPDGAFTETGDSFARLAWVGLTGDRVEEKDSKRAFLATREPGIWVLESDASVARAAPAPALVKGAKSGRRTWLDVSVLDGTLVAYEDETPVFATLISPGRGGIPARGLDPLETASTPTGTFRVDGKFVTATMVSSTNDLIVHTEVQYVQNFHGPHALHAAYWHDAWGEKKSGGCINLSPLDAQRLFAWTEPKVPEGWYGLRSVEAFGPATIVVVHK